MNHTAHSESAVATQKPGAKPPPRFFASLSPPMRKEWDRVLMEHIPQVRSIARRIRDRLPQSVPLEDLVQTGVLGLIEAMQNFDPTRNVQLRSYAKMRIQGAILDSLREMDWGPRTLRKKARQLDRARQTLMARLGRAPSETELADELGTSLRDLQHLLGEIHGLDVASLQAMGSEDGYRNEFASRLPCAEMQDPSELCLRSEMRALLTRAMRELSPRKRQVVALYYKEERTMKNVGAILGVGESRVSQIHTAALGRLRVRMCQLLESHPTEKETREGEAQEAAWESIVPGIDSPPVTRCARMRAEGPSGWGEVPSSLHLELSPGQAHLQSAASAPQYAARHVSIQRSVYAAVPPADRLGNKSSDGRRRFRAKRRNVNSQLTGLVSAETHPVRRKRWGGRPLPGGDVEVRRAARADTRVRGAGKER